MEFHPIANLFPMMPEKDLMVLAEDIKTNGQQVPIYVHEGKVLDGRNRYRACEISGVEPKTEPFYGTDPLAFVVSMNLKRRHLNESQRAMIAAKIANLHQGQHDIKPANLPVSQTQAAELLNVSERTVRNAKSVQEHGTKELVKAVESGEVAVSDAAAIVDMPKEEQRRALESVRSGKTKNLRKVKKEKIRRKRDKYPGVISKGLIKDGELLPIAHPDASFENEYDGYAIVNVRIVQEDLFRRLME